jgi:hypothetical protein
VKREDQGHQIVTKGRDQEDLCAPNKVAPVGVSIGELKGDRTANSKRGTIIVETVVEASTDKDEGSEPANDLGGAGTDAHNLGGTGTDAHKRGIVETNSPERGQAKATHAKAPASSIEANHHGKAEEADDAIEAAVLGFIFAQVSMKKGLSCTATKAKTPARRSYSSCTIKR